MIRMILKFFSSSNDSESKWLQNVCKWNWGPSLEHFVQVSEEHVYPCQAFAAGIILLENGVYTMKKGDLDGRKNDDLVRENTKWVVVQWKQCCVSTMAGPDIVICNIFPINSSIHFRYDLICDCFNIGFC